MASASPSGWPRSSASRFRPWTAIIAWAQELRGESYLEDGRLLIDSPSLAAPLRSGIPPVYGMRTVDDVVD
ncbi:MAG: hypothetical protein GY769_16075 [bacterium]|nr:hypothetical protein [bacterium]